MKQATRRKKKRTAQAGIVLICCLFPLLFSAAKPIDEVTTPQGVATGILLDTIGNEIYLAYENGKPAYYYANIFTPVCNTGECLPVFINLYWNLTGQYLRFDQPAGQILTKLDHVPFTTADYLLLDEILRGPDPRYDDLGNHIASPSPGSHGIQENHSEASPSPSIQSKKMVSKYEMIDGITGATAIRHQAKFVPGALYTTYTIWGLGNDHGPKMLQYTQKNLLTKDNFTHFIVRTETGCQYYAVEQVLTGKTGQYDRTNAVMQIIDTTTNEQAAAILINYIYYGDYSLDTVSNTLERKFFSSTGVLLQYRILYHWTYSHTTDKAVLRLAEQMHEFNGVFYSIVQLFQYKPYWPEALLAGGCS